MESSGKGTFNIRETLSEQQIQLLDEFKQRVFSLPPADSPLHKMNEKNKNKKRKNNEPPLQRLWTEALTEKQKRVHSEETFLSYH